MTKAAYIRLGTPVERVYSGKPTKVRVSKNGPREKKADRSREKPASVAKRLYKVRYGVMPAKSLPSTKLIPYHPGYGNPIGEHGSKSIVPESYRVQMMNNENGFYIKLEESLRDKGAINPIHALSIEEGTYAIYGASRLYMCQKLDLEVKVIITDFVDRWTELEELKTEEDVLAKFQNPPSTLVMDNERMRLYGCEHIHVGH